MAKTAVQRTTDWRNRKKEKRLRQEAAFDQVLAALVFTYAQGPDGSLKVDISLSKTCPEWQIFMDLADTLGRTPEKLFDQLMRGAARRYLAGKV